MPTLNPCGGSKVPPSQYSETNLKLKDLHQARQRRLTYQLKLVQLSVPSEFCEPFLCKASIYECVGESLGSIMWEGSLALAYFFLSRNLCPLKTTSTASQTHTIAPHSSERQVKILELGAGTGVAGLLLASVGVQAHITLSDLPLLIPLLDKNVKTNGQSERVCTRALCWGTDDTKQFTEAFDFVLAADVVYCAELIEPLLLSLCAVTNSDSTIIMAYRYRGPEEKRFFALAEQHFCVERVEFEQDWNRGLRIQRVVDEEETARDTAFNQSLAIFRNGASSTSATSAQRSVRESYFASHSQPICIFVMRRRKTDE